MDEDTSLPFNLPAIRAAPRSETDALDPLVLSVATPLSRLLAGIRNPSQQHALGFRGGMAQSRRVEMGRGGGRSNISVAAPFVWRCLTGSAMAPFPHPAHRTGQADLPHPALGQDVTPSPTTGRDQAGSGVRARSARKGAGVDRLRPCVARLCA